MIARIWRTEVELGRAAEYEQFARDVSLPMFRRQRGFRGVIMGRDGEACSVITLWESDADTAALDTSESYRETVAAILGRGFVRGEQSVEVIPVHLADLG